MAQTEPITQSLALERAGLPPLYGRTLNFRAISLLEGIRAAIAVAGTLAAGSLLGMPELGLAALGALLACFADPGGPVRTRLPPMLIFAIGGALGFTAFGLILAQSPILAILLAGVAIFLCSFARIYGQAGLQTGNLLAVAILLSLDAPIPTLAAAIAPTIAFWAGATGAAILTLALWRIRPFGPARTALANLSLALAALTRDLVALADDTAIPTDEDGFDLHARGHRRLVREAIEQARTIIDATIRRRGAASQRANTISLRLETFDQLFATLVAVGESMAADPTASHPARAFLTDLATLLTTIAPDIAADRSLDTPPLRATLTRLRQQTTSLTPDHPFRRLLETVADRLSVIMTVSNAAGTTTTEQSPTTSWRQTILTPIRTNLTLQSIPLRHALRTALVTTPLLGFVLWLGNPFGHWLTITVIFVLQPYFSGTWIRALERIAGTTAGGVIAALIGLFVQTKLELALAMIPLTLIAFAIRGVNYSAFIAVVTPMIVLLIEQLAPGQSQWQVALLRVGFTIAGGLIAVTANLILWPSFEGNRLATARDAAITAHRAYLVASFAHLLDNAASPDAARRQAGLASNNLEASLARALMEPHKTHDPLLRSSLVIDAALRRTAGRLAVLNLTPTPTENIDLWHHWQTYLTTAFTPTKPPTITPPPALTHPPTGESLMRLARQAELIRSAVVSKASASAETV